MSQNTPAGVSVADRPVAVSASIILAGLALGGLMLRLLYARGELWIDEIWSLALVAPLRHAGEVFFAVSHDNNHFLNSLWLALVGPDASALAYRAPAVVLGAGAVLAAAAAFARPPAAIAAAVLAAVAWPLAQHGSEARGYAGLIFCALVAFAAWLRREEAWLKRKWRWIFAAATGFGALFHLTMLAVPAVCGLATFCEIWRRREPAAQAFARLLRDFLPAATAALPALLALAIGIHVRGEFAVGGIQPFTLTGFAAGYGGALGGIFGIPEGFPAAWPGLPGLLAAAVVIVAGWGRLGQSMRALVWAGLVGLPLAMLALRLPNTNFPRYFLIPALILLLVMATLFDALWREQRTRRAGVLLAAAVLLLQAGAVVSALRAGRPEWLPLARYLSQQDEQTYATNSPFRVPMILAHHGRRIGSAPALGSTAACGIAPRWFVAESGPQQQGFPPQFVTGPSSCRQTYVREDLPGGGLRDWALYRRL